MKSAVAMLLCVSSFGLSAFASKLDQDVMKNLNYSCFIRVSMTNPKLDDDRSADGALTQLISISGTNRENKIATKNSQIHAVVSGPNYSFNQDQTGYMDSAFLSLYLKTGGSDIPEIRADKLDADLTKVTTVSLATSGKSAFLKGLAKSCDDSKVGYVETNEISFVCGPKQLLEERFIFSTASNNCSKLR